MVTWQSTSETWYIGIDGPDSLGQWWSNLVGVDLVKGYNVIPTSLTVTFDSDAIGIPANWAGGTMYPYAISSVTMQIGNFSFTTNTGYTLVGYPWACCFDGIGSQGDNSVQFIFPLPRFSEFEYFSGRSVYVAYFDANTLNGKLPIYPTVSTPGEIGIYSSLSQFRTQYSPEVVPEPSSITLLATGLLGVSPLTRRLFRRRREPKE